MACKRSAVRSRLPPPNKKAHTINGMCFFILFFISAVFEYPPDSIPLQGKAVFPFVQKSTPLNNMAFVRLIRATSTEY